MNAVTHTSNNKNTFFNLISWIIKYKLNYVIINSVDVWLMQSPHVNYCSHINWAWRDETIHLVVASLQVLNVLLMALNAAWPWVPTAGGSFFTGPKFSTECSHYVILSNQTRSRFWHVTFACVFQIAAAKRELQLAAESRRAQSLLLTNQTVLMDRRKLEQRTLWRRLHLWRNLRLRSTRQPWHMQPGACRTRCPTKRIKSWNLVAIMLPRTQLFGSQYFCK